MIQEHPSTYAPSVAAAEWPPVVLHLRPAADLTDEEFFNFCQLNTDLRFERTAQGDILIMPPTGGATSARNSRLVHQLLQWADCDGSGVVFDSSGGFILPNGATRSPDVAWVHRSRLVALTAQQKERFCPSARTSSSSCARRPNRCAARKPRWRSTSRMGHSSAGSSIPISGVFTSIGQGRLLNASAIRAISRGTRCCLVWSSTSLGSGTRGFDRQLRI